jgi:WhiB family redox-sensing transcriptional regulator
MAPMQWRDATVGEIVTTGFEASDAARREPDVRQIQGGYAGQGVRPVGFDVPCMQNPELFFAESPHDVGQAKAMCRGCGARITCLAGALERREPWGVWGGELLIRGTIVPHKRSRGRPRKTDVAA